MPVRYGATVENLNLIHEKARTKADGVYSFRGVAYLVRAGQFTHYACDGAVAERAGAFSVTLGGYYGDARKALREIA